MTTNSKDYESIAEAKRQALAGDVAELKDRLTAKDLVTSLTGALGFDTHSFQRSTGTDDDNLPYAMIGAGAAMLASRFAKEHDWEGHDETSDDHLMATDLGHAHRRVRQRQDEGEDVYASRVYSEYGRRLDIERRDGEDEESFMDRVDDAMHGLSGRMKHSYHRTGGAMSSAGRSVKGAASSTGSAIAGGAKSTGSAIKGGASSAGKSISSAAGATKHSVQERAAWLRDHAASLSEHAQRQAARARAGSQEKMRQIRTAHEDNPSVGLSLGMGLGLVFGALFPSTSREKKATDPLASALMDAANSALGRVNQKLDEAEGEQPSRMHH